jgi:uncharacterized protein YycO
MITLLFTAKKAPGSIFIRTATWSRWSHVALVCGDGTVIEAIGFKGVRRISFEEALHGSFRFALVEFKDVPDEKLQELIEKLNLHIGKKYDYLGALGIGLHRNWQSPNRWICSELIAWGLQEIGYPLFRKEEVDNVTQQDIWRLAPDGSTTEAHI